MKCNIAKDLLPLYFEGLCSDETKKQLEEHLKECDSCGQLKQDLEQSLERQQEWENNGQEWRKEIAPLQKIRKKVRKKNITITVCVFVLLLFTGITCLLAYGQITKKGLSFELIYDAVRLRTVGKQFAAGNIEPLYEILSSGYLQQNEEAGIVRLVYPDSQSYDEDMKKAIMEKYHQYFDGKSLTYKGMEEISYLQTEKTGWNRTLSAALKFEGKDRMEYYLVLYKNLNGQYLVDDYFGEPYLSYEADKGPEENDGAEEEAGRKETYHTDDTLFSCLAYPFTDFDLYLMRQVVLVSGQRALQGDKTLAKNGQMRLSIISEQDLKDGTNELREKADEELDRLAESGYYVTDLTLQVKEYDQTKHLYRYQVNIELTNETSLEKEIAVFDCYQIAGQFLYISGTEELFKP